MRAMLRLTGELDFSFEVGTAAYQRFVSSRGSRWPEQERLGRLPALQHTGLSACEITLDGVAYPGLLGGSVKSMFDLRGLSLSQKPYLLTFGTGKVCGYWAVLDVSDTRSIFMDNGSPRKIEFSIKLKYYGPNYNNRANVSLQGKSNLSSAVKSASAVIQNANKYAELPKINAKSSFEQLSNVAKTVTQVVSDATRVASEVQRYIANPMALVGLISGSVLPECLSSIKGIAQSAQSIMDAGERLVDCVSAVNALTYSLRGLAPERMGIVVETMRKGLGNMRDTARLASYSMGTIQSSFSTIGQTFARLGTREASAKQCQSVSEQAKTMGTACKTLAEDSSTILEKFE